MLVYKKGDVLKSDEKLIVHGCNCFCTMGAGIARQIRERYQRAYKVDQDTLWGDKTKLGNFTFAEELNDDGDVIFVVNAYTQYKYTRTDVDLDYDALRESITKICMTFPHNVIAMPKIGCGLAGGDWKKVSEILEKISDRCNKTFHIYEL
jgi:O-acetyl-ADP-ribose deacetylase (regulator of RNase III)